MLKCLLYIHSFDMPRIFFRVKAIYAMAIILSRYLIHVLSRTGQFNTVLTWFSVYLCNILWNNILNNYFLFDICMVKWARLCHWAVQYSPGLAYGHTRYLATPSFLGLLCLWVGSGGSSPPLVVGSYEPSSSPKLTF